MMMFLRRELKLEFLMFSSCTPKRSLWALPGGRSLLLDLDGEPAGGLWDVLGYKGHGVRLLGAQTLGSDGNGF